MSTAHTRSSFARTSPAQRTYNAALHATLFAAAMFAATSQAGSLARITGQLPDVPPPPQGEARWIARSMRVNGLPMSLKEFSSRLAPDDVLHHYESWSRALPHAQTRRFSNGPWRILAIESPCCYITVQAMPTLGGSEGALTATPPLARAELNLETQFPRPPGASVVNLQQYEDLGVESEHISLTSPRSPATEAHAYAQLLRREGWTLVRNGRGAHDARGRVIEAQKGAQHALLTLLPDRSRAAATAIVVVWRKA